jgi:hypothetical protein
MNTDVVINLDGWKMREFRKFSKCHQDGDLDAMIAMLEPIATFPDGIDGIDDLELGQWYEFLEVVGEKLTAKFQSSRKGS